MLKVRCRHSIAYFKGYVYVFGGESSDDETTLAQCEKYGIQQMSWTHTRSLPEPRKSFMAAANKEFIFLGGGCA